MNIEDGYALELTFETRMMFVNLPPAEEVVGLPIKIKHWFIDRDGNVFPLKAGDSK